MKTCQSELIQRENIADSLKRQNRELRHTLNLVQTSGKDMSMYTPQRSERSDGNIEGPHQVSRKTRSSAKYGNSEQKSTRTKQRSKTPGRGGDVGVRTIENNEGHQMRYSGMNPNRHLGGHRITNQGHNSAEQHTESDARLNKLINDYRMENERCTTKISELKQRLVEQQEHDSLGAGTDSMRGGASDHNKIYAKSFKATSDKMGSGKRKASGADKVPSYYHHSGSKNSRI